MPTHDSARLDPGPAPSLASAKALHRALRFPEAAAAYRAHLLREPDAAVALQLLGLVTYQLGRLPQAIALVRRAVRIAPATPIFLDNYGELLSRAGRNREALAAFDRAAVLQPTQPTIHHNRARALQALGRLAAAEQACRASLTLDPAAPGPLLLYADMLRERGRLPTALALADHAARLTPGDADAHTARGDALLALRRGQDAIAAYDEALRQDPGALRAMTNRGLAQAELGLLDAAMASYRAAIALRPYSAPPWTNLASALMAGGRPTEAIAAARRGVLLQPERVQTHRNLLIPMMYDPTLDHATRFAMRCAFEDAMARPLYATAPVAFANSPDPGRRLRVGYLSSDLRDHVVARAMLPLLQAHDRAAVEAFCYSTTSRPDRMTERLRKASDHWRTLAGESDAAIAAAISRDGIDILVVIAANFDQNRPLVCARRPAPVQVSFLDCASSGISAIDYFLTDATLLPRDSGEKLAERPFRTPLMQMVMPLEAPPPVAPPPSLAGAPFTFGSFNNPAKVSDGALALWARVLAAVPGSRLLLKYRARFGEESVRARVLGAIAEAGVDPARVDLLSGQYYTSEHLRLYEQIDVALDPFPFTGWTTSIEAMSMGVPVVTLPGDTIVGRGTLMMLRVLGRDELIARDADDYVAICRRLAGDPATLLTLRNGLRDEIAASRLCDAPRQARHLERAYRAMWRRWCAGVTAVAR